MLQSRVPEMVSIEVECQLFGIDLAGEAIALESLAEQPLDKVLRLFKLLGLPRRPNLEELARKWGVVSIQRKPIESDAMLFADGDEFFMVINSLASRGNPARQRFSFAHELGHLLLQVAGLSKFPRTVTQHRQGARADKNEERLCDAIAAEILMPRLAFQEDAWMEGWSLRSLRTLSRLYETSLEATARRMVDLNPESSLMSLWFTPSRSGGAPKLHGVYSGDSGCSVPRTSASDSDNRRLLQRAFDSGHVETGIAPIAVGESGRLAYVPAEALAWGRGEYRQAIVFYYPRRNVTAES